MRKSAIDVYEEFSQSLRVVRLRFLDRRVLAASCFLVMVVFISRDLKAESKKLVHKDVKEKSGKLQNKHQQQRLRTYLQREVTRSARHLDHGVFAANVGVGVPHVYQLGVAIGLFDHITLGVTTHWLFGQKNPGFSPKVALAFYRSRFWEVGVHYHQTLNPPPRENLISMLPPFQRRAAYLLANISFSQAWFTAGLDIGWARGREANEFANEEMEPAFFVRNRLGGGIHFRFGNRRLGVIAQATYPYISFDLSFEVRFSLFEFRARGGWKEW